MFRSKYNLCPDPVSVSLAVSLSYSTFFLFLIGHFFHFCAPMHNVAASFSIHFLLVNSFANGVPFSLSRDRCTKGKGGMADLGF